MIDTHCNDYDDYLADDDNDDKESYIQVRSLIKTECFPQRARTLQNRKESFGALDDVKEESYFTIFTND